MSRRSKIAIVMGMILTGILTVALILGFRYFSYGKIYADLTEWYASLSGTPVYYAYERESYTAKIEDEEVYLPLSAVQKRFNGRFFFDGEGILMLTLSEGTVELAQTEEGIWLNGEYLALSSPVWMKKDGVVYVSLSVASFYSNLSYTRFTEPDRIILTPKNETETWGSTEQIVQVRTKAGRKAEILTDLEAGVAVKILGTVDDWTWVCTEDGIIGYVPTSKLSGETKNITHFSAYTESVFPSKSLSKPVVLVWHQLTNREGNAKLAEYLDETTGVNVIAPTWFFVSKEDGSIISYADRTYVEEAHSRGILVWGLVNDFDKTVEMKQVLENRTSRRALIAALMEEADRVGLDGINIDFERIKSDAGEAFLQFLRELSVACHKRGMYLSVDNYSPTGGWSWYDMTEQGKVADYVILMGYDEHWSGGAAGSTASLPYTEETIQLTLDRYGVPVEKLIHGIPFYTRVWSDGNGESSSTAVSMVRAKALLEEHGAELTWLTEEGQFYGEYNEEGVRYRIWLEDAESIRLKLQVIKEQNLAGVACWKLSLEDPVVWTLIESIIK